MPSRRRRHTRASRRPARPRRPGAVSARAIARLTIADQCAALTGYRAGRRALIGGGVGLKPADRRVGFPGSGISATPPADVSCANRDVRPCERPLRRSPCPSLRAGGTAKRVALDPCAASAGRGRSRSGTAGLARRSRTPPRAPLVRSAFRLSGLGSAPVEPGCGPQLSASEPGSARSVVRWAG
jgi:hypothetical protein